MLRKNLVLIVTQKMNNWGWIPMGLGLKTNIADNLLKYNSGGGGGSGTSYIKVPEYTIAANRFTLDSDTGVYTYTIVDRSITSDSIVTININSTDSASVASAAGLSSTVNSIDGGIVLTSKNIPTADIVCSYVAL